jgi:hypothetical protein
VVVRGDRIGAGRAARDEMTVRVELASDSVDAAILRADLEEQLRQDLGVRVAVEPAAPGSLAELTNFGREGKVRRLHDRWPGSIRQF